MIGCHHRFGVDATIEVAKTQQNHASDGHKCADALEYLRTAAAVLFSAYGPQQTGDRPHGKEHGEKPVERDLTRKHPDEPQGSRGHRNGHDALEGEHPGARTRQELHPGRYQSENQPRKRHTETQRQEDEHTHGAVLQHGVPQSRPHEGCSAGGGYHDGENARKEASERARARQFAHGTAVGKVRGGRELEYAQQIER